MPKPTIFQGEFYLTQPYLIPSYTNAGITRVISKIVLRVSAVSPVTVTNISIKIAGFYVYRQQVTGSATIELDNILLAQFQGFPYDVLFESDTGGSNRVYVDATSTLIRSGDYIPYTSIGSLNASTFQYSATPSSGLVDIIRGIIVTSRSASDQTIKIGTKKFTGVGNLYQFTLPANSSAFVSDIAHLVTNSEDDRLEIISTDNIDYYICHARTFT